MADLEKKRGLFEISFETRQLIDQGREVKENEIWLYTDMNKLIGLDVQNEHRGMLSTARDHLRRDHGYIFDSIPNKGLLRLGNDEKTKLSDRTISGFHRKIQRTREALGTIDVAALTPEKKTELYTGITVLHVVDQATQAKTQKKIRGSIEKTGNILPVKDTLKLFGLDQE